MNSIADILGGHEKLIMDPVHGGIALFKHEVDVIDHPLFQRLRNICQNDILSLVFPGATHSRFLHSIGAMHVCTRMIFSMVDAYVRDRKHRKRFDFTTEHLESINYLSKVARLGCLLHDIGHASFSHQFSKTQKMEELVSKPDRFVQLWQGLDYNRLYTKLPQTLEHEHYSIRCAYEVFEDINLHEYGIDPIDVLGIMETTDVRPGQAFRHFARIFWEFIADPASFHDTIEDTDGDERIAKMVQNFLSSIVSGEIDADRADYMLRDGFHSSVSIGSFNLDHLLSNLRFGWNLDTPWLGLAITKKGLGALEDFVYSRHQMYRQVYAHKTALGFDWILREAINEVLSDPEYYDYIDLCLSNVKDFGQLTDHFFWEAFRKISLEDTQSYSRCIIERIKLHHIDTLEDAIETEIVDKRKTLAQRIGTHYENIVTCTMKARFSTIQDDFNKIKVLVKDRISGKRQLKQITEISNFFTKFSDETIVHFYLKPFVTQAQKPAAISACKQQAQSKAQPGLA
ncbi:MAG: phosphohydrolase [Proteobacteria bacterium]|nr:MAG: phosphohydrolase [Pseudomonadota bacterium]